MPLTVAAQGQVGAVAFFPQSSAPAGWMKANGAAVSRAAYSALFLVIGTTFGAGDGATTFNVPDLRGEFLRGFDDGRGVDAGRGFGSGQGGAVESHSHGLSGYGVGDWGGYDQYLRWEYRSANPASGGVSAAGGVETHPRNVALLACIKY